MRATRIVLVLLGVALIVTGAIVMQQTVRPVRIAGVVLWLALALVVHDGIIAPIVVGVGALLRRTGRRIPIAVLAMVQGALVIGSVFTLIVGPEIRAKQLGVRNVTVLPFDYAGRLALLWAALAVLTALAVVIYLAATRRQKLRPATVHDAAT